MRRLSSIPVLGSVGEFFAMREAARRAEGLDEAKRAAAERDLRVSDQKDEAATRLAAQGAHAEALSLAREAFDLAAAVAREIPPSARALVALERARAAIEGANLPRLEGEVSLEHEELRSELLRARRRVADDLADVVVPPKSRTRVRVARALFSAVCFLLVFFCVRWAWKKPPHLTAMASASWNPYYGAFRALDGEQATEWLLPDRSTGWIEISPIKPTPMRRLKLLNARNAPGPDRATHEFKLEVYADSQVVKTIDDSFGPFSVDPKWKVIDLGVPGKKVQKIRITVKTWHGDGAGLAEVVVE